MTHPPDVRYLTGFHGESTWALVLARSNRVYLLSDSRFEEEIASEAPDSTAVLRKAGSTLSEELSKVVKRHRLGKVGFQSAHLSVAQRRDIVRRIGGRTVSPINDGLMATRAIKDPSELRLIQGAIQIQQKAFARTVGSLRGGMTEGEIAGILEMHMRALGAEAAAFPTIVACGSNSSKPHCIPGRRKLKSGGIVLVDWGATYRGYRSDMTRVLALDKMPRRVRKVYAIVLEAQLAAIDKIAPGVALAEVDGAARQLIERAGYGEHFHHGLGHGIGLEIHEQPSLSPVARGELETGQVVTVEPGIYLPGFGGVRIEDDVLVTARGSRVLSDLPKSLESAILC